VSVVRISWALLMFVPGLAWAVPASEELMLANRLAEALPAARREAAAAPSDVAAQERYYDLLLTLGLPHVAVADARKRVEAAPADADAHYLLGRAVPGADQARREYEAALRLDPDHARAQMGMGAVYRSTGQLGDAEDAYRRALQLDPTLNEAWSGLVYVLLSGGRGQEALDTARRCIVALPDASEGYLTIAVLAPNEAESILATAAKRIPHDPRVHARLAEVRLAKGNGKGAKQAADAALLVDPGHADALLARVFAESMVAGALDADGYVGLVDARGLEQRDPAGAITAYDALVKRYPKSALPLVARARVKAQKGDTAGARKDLEAALALEPANVEAQGALGLLLQAQGEAAAARPHLVAAAKARPTDASLAVAAGQAEAASGQVEAAKTRLAAAAEKWPYDVRVALAKAQVQSASGDTEGAYFTLREFAKRVPDGRVVLALVAAAKDTGRYGEAARILDDIAAQTGEPAWSDLADKVRAGTSAP
jgi:tetratricopeptide (TPR) repeat protein